jgi:sorting nexin-27
MAGYLAAVREMDGYGGVVFPHCGADARKEGHVVPVVTFDAFRLHACREGGELEDQVIEFAWDTITTFEIDEESMTFVFQYRRAGKPDRTVRIYSHFYVFLFECFEKIQEEIGWTKQLESHQGQ